MIENSHELRKYHETLNGRICVTLSVITTREMEIFVITTETISGTDVLGTITLRTEGKINSSGSLQKMFGTKTGIS